MAGAGAGAGKRPLTKVAWFWRIGSLIGILMPLGFWIGLYRLFLGFALVCGVLEGLLDGLSAQWRGGVFIYVEPGAGQFGFRERHCALAVAGAASEAGLVEF